MHGIFRWTRLLMLLFFTLWGCGGSPNLLKEIPTTINTVKSSKGQVKLVPMVLIGAPQTNLGRGVGDIYFSTLSEAIHKEDDRSKLLTLQDSEFPSFLGAFKNSTPNTVNAAVLSKKAREEGYQGIVTAAVNDIRAVAKKTGVLWLRKTRHFINYTVTVELYDPYTAAKIVNEVVEGTIRISEDDYDTYQAGTATSISDLNEEIEGVAQDLGEIVGKALKVQQWRAAVTEIKENRIMIPVGRWAGLKEGDRLAVFEGQRFLEGVEGATYIVPGIQIGEIQITSISDNMANAKALNSGNIQVGDLVVPIK